jgi:hypothetical protein
MLLEVLLPVQRRPGLRFKLGDAPLMRQRGIGGHECIWRHIDETGGSCYRGTYRETPTGKLGRFQSEFRVAETSGLCCKGMCCEISTAWNPSTSHSEFGVDETSGLCCKGTRCEIEISTWKSSGLRNKTRA